MYKSRIALFLLCMVFYVFSFAAGITVVYPANEMASDNRYNDLLEILKMALEKTAPEFGPFELGPSDLIMTEARYLFELKNGKHTNIAWSSTSVEKETELLPLRIPLRKGILGYRVAFTSKSKQAKIDQVKTLDGLKALTVGQGVGWGDVKLYEANGIKVIVSKYENLFKMTAGGRFDIFPRGISEIGAEFASHGKDNPTLVVEQNLLIYYPWPYYFFFNKKDVLLRKRIESGILLMKKDGSFDAIFNKFNSKAIEQANLKNRRVIKIKNDMLPKETPLNDPTLWFDPTAN